MTEKDQLMDELNHLRKKVVDLERDNRLFKEAENKLQAANQQLHASEQQVQAANQELKASEQQLLAANQQLQANEQQLKAANQELEASEQQLRQANIKIKESEQQFRQLFENMAQGFAVHEMIYDENNNPIDYRFLHINKSFEKLTGINASDYIGKTVKQLIPGIEQIWIDNYGRVAKTGNPMQFEHYSKEFDKYYNVIAYSAKKNFFATVFTDTTNDIIQRKQLLAAKELAERNEIELIKAQEITHIGSWYLDINTNEVVWSKELYKMYGFDPNLPVPPYTEHIKLFTPESWEILSTSLAKTSEKGIPYELELKTVRNDKSNGWMWVRGEALYDENKKIVGLWGAAQDITERKQTEQEIKEKANYINKIINTSALSTWISDKNGTAIQANQACLDFFGAKEEEVIGKYNIFKDSVLEKLGFIPDIQKVFEKGEVANLIIDYNFGEVDHVSVKNATHKIANSIFTPILDVNGEILNVIVQTIDLSEIKSIEKELIKAKERAEENERKLIEAQELSHIGSWEYIVDTDTVTWSKELFKIFELSPDLPAPKYSLQQPYYTEESFALLDKAVQDCVQREIPYEIELDIILPNGSKKQIISKGDVIRDENNIIIGSYGTAQDITQKKKIEYEIIEAKVKAEESKENLFKANEQLKLHNERLEAITRILNNDVSSQKEMLDYTLLQAVTLTESKIGYIYFYNEERKEFTLNTWSGEVMKECMVVDPKTVYQLDSTGCWGEAVRQRKPFMVNDYAMPNTYKKGTPEGHVQLKKFLTIPVIIEDEIKAVIGVGNKQSNYNDEDVKQLSLLMNAVWKIVERDQYQKDIIKAKEKAEESDRLKSAFLANMSHEIRTPMNGILGFTSLLQEPELSGQEQQKYIDIIQKSGVRMLNTVNDIIDISKIESGLVERSLSEVNINEQLKNLYLFFKPESAKKGIRLVLKNTSSEQDNRFITDLEKFNSILTNLIKNAIKYTNEGTIELGYNIQLENGLSELKFYVKDSGIGIPKHRQNAIFDRFIQADIEDKQAKQGSGLGLAISKAYAEMLGGKIWVESEVGEGSTFYFTIEYHPVTESNSDIANDEQILKEENLNGKFKILVVEDDETSQELISIVVEKFAKEIIEVSTGLEAVEICRNNPDIDLILMDIQLPNINGYEATRQIRQFNKDVIILAQTAYALAGDKEKAISAGCNDYISKPIIKEELLTLIQLYFKRM